MPMKPWYRSGARIVWWIFSRLWAPFMAVGWPLLAFYGFVHPRTEDLVALNLQRGEHAVLVGVAGSGNFVGRESPLASNDQRSYVVLPRSLVNGAGYLVVDTPSGRTVVREPGAALLIIAIWMACAFGTWYYWVRKAHGHLTIAGAVRDR